jgi:hypothetical protein
VGPFCDQEFVCGTDEIPLRTDNSVKELLDQSPHDIAWMELGFAHRPDLVSNVTNANLLFRLSQGRERLLTTGRVVYPSCFLPASCSCDHFPAA